MNFTTIEEIAQVNTANGYRYFDAVPRWGLSVVPGVYGGRYFIVSLPHATGVQQYSVKGVMPNGYIATFYDSAEPLPFAKAVEIASALPPEALPYGGATSLGA